MPARQTLSVLARRFQQAGIRPDTRHGQNFLVDQNLLRLLVDAAKVGDRDVVLEVGTGTGGLTQLLVERAAEVVSVEIDANLFRLAAEELAGVSNLTLLHGDALARKNRLDPRILETVMGKLDAAKQRQFKLVANLPFNVATPILSNLLVGPCLPVSMTATIQRELADRIVALPGTRDYGALSLWMQCQSRARIVRVLPPSVFWPRPKVHSAIVHIDVDLQRRRCVPDIDYWHRFVRAVFLHRRKFLRGVLISALKGPLSKGDVDAVLSSLGLGPTVRAEQLDLTTMLALCERVRSLAPQWKL
jgi:16S rRNA (adenine1518-N6/adenine1519-N6)-dimethyltransferase